MIITINRINSNYFNNISGNVSYRDFNFKRSDTQPGLSELVRFLRE